MAGHRTWGFELGRRAGFTVSDDAAADALAEVIDDLLCETTAELPGVSVAVDLLAAHLGERTVDLSDGRLAERADALLAVLAERFALPR
jgi:hypothetical protein